MGRKRPAAPRQQRQIERKIYFYRVKSNSPLDIEDLFGRAAGVTPDVQLHPTREVGDRRTLCVVVRQAWPIRVAVSFMRMTGIPDIMNVAGAERPIELQEDEGIREKTHLVFFQDGIVGCEMNFYGPKPEHLFPHLGRFTGPGELVAAACPAMQILLREDAFAKLPENATVTLIRVKLTRVLAEEVADLPGADRTPLMDAIASTAACGSPEMIEIVLRGPPRSRSGFWDGAADAARTLLGLPQARSHLKKLELDAYDPDGMNRVLVDLLSDRLVHAVKLVPASGRSRSPLSADIFSAIEQGYTERRDDLHTAAGVTS